MTLEKIQFSMPQTHSELGPRPDAATPEKRDLVAQRVRLLFGCYRKADASDPGTYTVAVASVLLRYPEDIIITVTDPVEGLASKSQWLPSVAEVRAECDRLMELRYPPETPKSLPEPNWKPDPPDVRAAAVARWRQMAESFDRPGEEPISEFRKAVAADDAEAAKAISRKFFAGVQVSEEFAARASKRLSDTTKASAA